MSTKPPTNRATVLASPPTADIVLGFSHVYWTHAELFGEAMSRDELVATLGTLAVEDCVEAISRLSCMIEGLNVVEPTRQLQILRRIGFGEALVEELQPLLERTDSNPGRAFFFPQQTVHLMRMALRHCEQRPRDGFGGGRLAGSFIKVLFGVTDVFEPELTRGNPDDVRGFMLRQSGLRRSERVYLFTRYYELLVRLWPQVHQAGTGFEPQQAFQRHTGVTLEQYFLVAFLIYTRFLAHVDSEHEPPNFALDPSGYFSDARIEPDVWRRVVDLLAATPDVLRERLDAEDIEYGPTTYRSHTFDRVPLVRLANGWFVPCSFAALERAVTEGPFWLLADAATQEGRAREDFTSPFGKVFERYAQESLERIAKLEASPPATHRDSLYGKKRQRVLSSDMTFVYEREAIFFEVVTGRLQVATETRGDPGTFDADLRRLVLTKARQLRRCYQDFSLFGTLRFSGVGRERIRTAWPVLIVIEGFPLMPPIIGEVERRVRRDGWPRGAPRITFLDADELGAIERLVELGWTTLGVIRQWKREAPDLPFGNWLSRVPELKDGIGHATRHRAAFDELYERVGALLGPDAVTGMRQARADRQGTVEPAGSSSPARG